MKKKFAILGCGHIAHRHFQHISNRKDAEVIGVYDTHEERLSSFSAKYKVRAFQSFDELLKEQEIDVVNVCTPNGTHASLAVSILQSGKHVVVEKPMAITPASAIEMDAVAKKTGYKLFVVKQNRYNPPVAAVKKLIENGQLGNLFLVNVNCYWNRNEEYYKQSYWRGTKDLDGGTLYTQFSHFVDILYYLFGEIKDINGQVSNASHQELIEFEDTGTFAFTFKNGGLGNLNFTTSAFKQNMEGSITIFAENATIKIGGKYLNTIDYQVTDGFDIEDIPVSSPANNYGFYEGSMSNHDKVIENVVNTLNGEEEIMTNSEDGMKVVQMISDLYAGAKSE